jgi:hypothetical protein
VLSARGSVVAHALDARERAPHVALLQALADIVVELLDARAQRVDVLARIADLERVRRTVMGTHALLGGGAQRLSELLADGLAAVELDGGHVRGLRCAETLSGRIGRKQSRRLVRREVLHVLSELRKREVDGAFELARAVTQVLHQAVAQAHQLAELARRRIRQHGGSGPLLLSKTRRALRRRARPERQAPLRGGGIGGRDHSARGGAERNAESRRA